MCWTQDVPNPERGDDPDSSSAELLDLQNHDKDIKFMNRKRARNHLESSDCGIGTFFFLGTSEKDCYRLAGMHFSEIDYILD